METRQITEYKIYVLELAEMHGGVDKAVPVVAFDDYQKLKDYYNSQLAPEPYNDGEWYKVFKKGSLFEWYNPADTLEIKNYADCAFGGVRISWERNLNFRVPFNPN